ncbi:hypothetical protein DCS_05487 [Drechmeria coniospora]|uniref:S-adenosyl-L-methionine-dependent methyltransferase n=1 Tax=Drechmeria coniospora TaxID=98403 RepID=A0A151GN59_DRECN|nr:hypothetical protein DCS_05487 [Drechmeria coniospora]KYK58471.1 hypothetical protein DCS_05487 [Drechmeria coniospora]
MEEAYFLPNDKAEQNRLNFQHEMCIQLLDGKLGLAAVTSPKHVLDIATGTGIWAIQYAQQNPDSEVIGTDLSSIQPKAPVPNCSFIQQDVEHDDWYFSRNFDYIYLRFVVSCFDNTKSVIQRAFDNLNPGGHIEFLDYIFEITDFDGTTKGTFCERWFNLIHKGGNKIGRDFTKPARYATWCREVGFLDVEEKYFPVPCGTWPKDPKMKKIGKYFLHDLQALMEGMKKFLGFAGLSHNEIEDLVEKAKKDAEDPSMHFAVTIVVTHGRKQG